MTRDELRAALGDSNVQGWLRVIREGESNQNEDAYTVINGGEHFSGFARHPWQGIPTTQGAKACGAYQFLGTTWQRLVDQYGFSDFSPSAQDEGAVALTAGRGALDDVLAGNLLGAIAKCAQEWVSLGVLNPQRAERIFTQYGGVLGAAATPAPPEAVQPLPEQSKAPMGIAEIISIFGPILSQFIPQAASVLKPGSASASSDAAVIQQLLNIVTQAVGALPQGGNAGLKDVATAVETMKADPTQAAAAQKAVVNDPEIMKILEIGAGGIGAARAAAAIPLPTPDHWWAVLVSPTFLISCALLGIIYLFVLNILGAFGSYQEWDANTRSNLAFTIVAAFVGAITGFWFGTTMNSAKKDQVIAAAAGVPSQGSAPGA